MANSNSYTLIKIVRARGMARFDCFVTDDPELADRYVEKANRLLSKVKTHLEMFENSFGDFDSLKYGNNFFDRYNFWMSIHCFGVDNIKYVRDKK